MLLIKKDVTRKGQEFLVPEFELVNDKKYEKEAI